MGVVGWLVDGAAMVNQVSLMATSYGPYSIQSRRLYRMINSPWYDFIPVHLSPELSFLKPRLM